MGDGAALVNSMAMPEEGSSKEISNAEEGGEKEGGHARQRRWKEHDDADGKATSDGSEGR